MTPDNPIIIDVNDPLFIKRESWLRNQIQQALNQPFLTFSELSTIQDMGLYFIYDDQELLYIGMTTRNGTYRLKEMTNGFRSHTFNRKLVAEHMRGLGHNMHVLNSKKLHAEWIETGLITKEDFKGVQKQVNDKIRLQFRFKFYQTRYINLQFIEHFAIAVLQPLYND
jgi:hypothetical protein